MGSPTRSDELQDGTSRLSGWTSAFSERGRDLASECDRWFVGVFLGLARGARWARTGLGALGSHLVPRSWTGGESRRDRLRRLLLAEARRSRLPVSDRELRLFLENMATVLELVFGGAIGIDDISFEQDQPPGRAPGPSDVPGVTTDDQEISSGGTRTAAERVAARSPELGEEVADEHEAGQYQEEPAL